MGSYVLNKASIETLHKVSVNNYNDKFSTRVMHTFQVKYKPLMIKKSIQIAKRLSTNKYLLILKKHSKANSIAWLGRDC